MWLLLQSHGVLPEYDWICPFLQCGVHLQLWMNGCGRLSGSSQTLPIWRSATSQNLSDQLKSISFVNESMLIFIQSSQTLPIWKGGTSQNQTEQLNFWMNVFTDVRKSLKPHVKICLVYQTLPSESSQGRFIRATSGWMSSKLCGCPTKHKNKMLKCWKHQNVREVCSSLCGWAAKHRCWRFLPTGNL